MYRLKRIVRLERRACGQTYYRIGLSTELDEMTAAWNQKHNGLGQMRLQPSWEVNRVWGGIVIETMPRATDSILRVRIDFECNRLYQGDN